MSKLPALLNGAALVQSCAQLSAARIAATASSGSSSSSVLVVTSLLFAPACDVAVQASVSRADSFYGFSQVDDRMHRAS
jgi:hypothetical protein